MNLLTFTKGDGSTFDILLSTGSVASASYSATASYVLPLNQDVIITGSLLLTGSHISVVDYIDFNNTGIPTPTDQEGRIYWDEDNGTLSLGMHGGQVVQQVGLEEYFYVKNQTGVTIPNGSVVRSAGTLGASGRILGDLMIADGTIPYYFALGVATEDIVDGDDGYVTQFGLVRGLNTTGSNGETWNDGDILYASPTVLGGLTKFEPEAPNLRIQLAIVIDAAVNGSIFVRPDLGSDVGSLHDVIDTTTTASYGELFVKSGSVWTSTKQLTGSYGLTGSLNVTGSNTNLNSSITTKTTRVTGSAYTILNTDYRIGVRYSLTGSCTLQLPDISTYGERELRIKDEEGDADTNNIIVSASAGDLIDGSSTLILDRNYIAISLYNDGISNWYIE